MPTRTLNDMSKAELLELLCSHFDIASDSSVDAVRNKLVRMGQRMVSRRNEAEDLARLLVAVRERLATACGHNDQLLLCRVAEVLMGVRDMVGMAGHALRQHELVFGVVSLEPNTDLKEEVEQLNWAVAVLMGRSTASTPHWPRRAFKSSPA